MRSFENRKDTEVIDEPFYAYYLQKTGLKHPMYEKIIETYETDLNKIIKRLTIPNQKNYFIKNMTHHMLENISLDWIRKTKNFFLIRHPNKVIKSYIKKNSLINSSDLGYPEQLKIYKYVKSNSTKEIIVVNSDKLLDNPKKIIRKLCNKLDINFELNMLEWPKGKRNTDGIWSTVLYNNVINSTNFYKDNKVEKLKFLNKYNDIYDECFEIYNELNKYSI